MYVLNIVDDCYNYSNSTQLKNDENDIINLIIKLFVLSISGGLLILSLIGLVKYTALKVLKTNKW